MESAALVTCDDSTGWLSALVLERFSVSEQADHLFGGTDGQLAYKDANNLLVNERVVAGGSQYSNALRVYVEHRRRLYIDYALDLAHVADVHYFYQFMMWCQANDLFIHPSLSMRRESSIYRDHTFRVTCNVRRLTPLLAIPESLLIGFKDFNEVDEAERNSLFDARREREFNALNAGTSEDADVCQFFFASLGTLVSDLLTAKASPLTDVRHHFATALTKVRTLQNAPYFDDDVAFDPEKPCLADVLLQMIRNYINGGPLVNKVPRQELQWAVSLCLSHSTPLSIASVRSIGILPVVHLFPHGGLETNTYLVARTARASSAARMAAYFAARTGYDFGNLHEGKWVYVVPERDLQAGEEVRLQAMAPVCEKDTEAEQMWRLSCGSAPASYKTSADVAAQQARLTDEIIQGGR